MVGNGLEDFQEHEFSYDRAHQVGSFVAGLNASYSSKNSNERCSNRGAVSIVATIKESSTETTSYKTLALVNTVSKPCDPSPETILVTLTSRYSLLGVEQSIRIGHGWGRVPLTFTGHQPDRSRGNQWHETVTKHCTATG